MMLFGLTWMDWFGLRDALKELGGNTNKTREKNALVLAALAEHRVGTSFYKI